MIPQNHLSTDDQRRRIVQDFANLTGSPQVLCRIGGTLVGLSQELIDRYPYQREIVAIIQPERNGG